MRKAGKLLFLAILALALAHLSEGAPRATELEPSNVDRQRARSLCNTFGGCGPARSLELEPSMARAATVDGQHTYWSSNGVEEKGDQVGSLIGFIGSMPEPHKGEASASPQVVEETSAQLLKGDGEEPGEDPEQLVRGRPKQLIYFIGNKDITLDKLASLPEDFQGGPHLVEADPKDYELQ